MENDETREQRHVFAAAVREYRERVNSAPGDSSVEHDAAREVAEKHGVSQKDLREQAKAGV